MFTFSDYLIERDSKIQITISQIIPEEHIVKFEIKFRENVKIKNNIVQIFYRSWKKRQLI
jgi:hypothetical protein